MFTNRLEQKHWVNVAARFATDMLNFFLAFVLAMMIRFRADWWLFFPKHWLPMATGAFATGMMLYVAGYYSPRSSREGMQRRAVILTLIVGAGSIVILVAHYAYLSKPLGRGVMFLGTGIAFFLLALHHMILNKLTATNRIQLAMIVTSFEDELEAAALKHNFTEMIDIVGLLSHNGYEPQTPDIPTLGNTGEAETIASAHGLERVICTNRGMAQPLLFRKYCELQYMGVSVQSVIGLYEEFHQICPINLLSPEWMLEASTAPQVLYIRKFKRAFDIIVSVVGLLFLGPVLLLAAGLQKLVDSGPLLYRQKRLGRFGREFTVLKLRTMRVDAEKDGAQWSSTGDPRTTALGKVYRKYRIDEIPQLFNVLRGEMSFVGPRPERPEFTEALSDDIPFFLERLLVQPGLTGWAQVSYPYGATVDDARRKLEYDLYYIKHMSTFFDLFLLLDTVRIILTGGSHKPPELIYPTELKDLGFTVEDTVEEYIKGKLGRVDP